ncbi:L-aspartate oxidase [Bacteroidia bacterium]|nr:L-aspartate oxidase [Bacteroidia bacterium]GHV44384.1 L-aspartate oxidase [Bacteroidia bacterium]
MLKKYDFLIVGGGIAGISCALKAAKFGKVALLCKTNLHESNTSFAQGGVACVTYAPDTFEKHIEDTLVAGDGHCNLPAVEQVVKGAPAQIEQLIAWKTDFDKTDDGKFDLHKEGGHSEFRILHHADNTGYEIQESLTEYVQNQPNIDIFENYFAIEILTQHHLGKIVTHHYPNIECYGVYALNQKTNQIHTFLSKVTMLATGGIGGVYAATTNPAIATGDGIAMVHRARGVIKDMEFVQFHPTALYSPGERPTYLITEAMRGYGAVLRTQDGKEFMQKYDERGSLAPRDIVSRAIDNEMKTRGEDFVYLDVTHKNADETRQHFPNIYQECLAHGIDITKDYIPVSPCEHYLCGGIAVDLNGKSSINRLYAIGECSCTGLHGANRLASNSLIEAIVYAEAAIKDAAKSIKNIDFQENVPAWNDAGTRLIEEMVLISQSFREVEQIMSSYVGIVRSNLRLQRAMSRLAILYRETEDLFSRSVVSREICELRNVISVSYLIIKQALVRKQSIGLHYTMDYPKKGKKR